LLLKNLKGVESRYLVGVKMNYNINFTLSLVSYIILFNVFVFAFLAKSFIFFEHLIEG